MARMGNYVARVSNPCFLRGDTGWKPMPQGYSKLVFANHRNLDNRKRINQSSAQ